MQDTYLIKRGGVFPLGVNGWRMSSRELSKTENGKWTKWTPELSTQCTDWRKGRELGRQCILNRGGPCCMLYC